MKSLWVGVSLVLIASLLMAILTVLGKIARVEVGAPQVVFFANAIALLCVAPRVLRHGWRGLATQHPIAQLVRALSGAVAWWLYFMAVALSPLVDVTLLGNSAPLWTPILVWIVFRSRPRSLIWAGIALGFAGVIVILKPGFGLFSLGGSFALIASVLIAIAWVTVRYLGRGDSASLILFYYFTVASVAMLPWMIVDWATPSSGVWLALIGAGLCTLAYQLLLTAALKRAPVAVVTPLFFITVVFAGLFDWLIWGMMPSWTFYLGAALVIAGAIWVVLSGRQPSRSSATS